MPRIRQKGAQEHCRKGKTDRWNNHYVRLAYKLYFFSQRTIFFSHNKSANSTFSHDLSAKRTGQIVLEFEPCMGEFYTFICASVIDSISVIIVMEFR